MGGSGRTPRKREREDFALVVTASTFGVAAIVLLVMTPICAWVSPDRDLSQRAMVRNSSGRELRELHLLLRDPEGSVVLNGVAARLPTGRTLELPHTAKESEATLHFTIDGTRFKVQEPRRGYTAGQSWAFDVGPGGRVTANTWFTH